VFFGSDMTAVPAYQKLAAVEPRRPRANAHTAVSKAVPVDRLIVALTPRMHPPSYDKNCTNIHHLRTHDKAINNRADT
jgi:hypothetical protein